MPRERLSSHTEIASRTLSASGHGLSSAMLSPRYSRRRGFAGAEKSGAASKAAPGLQRYKPVGNTSMKNAVGGMLRYPSSSSICRKLAAAAGVDSLESLHSTSSTPTRDDESTVMSAG